MIKKTLAIALVLAATGCTENYDDDDTPATGTIDRDEMPSNTVPSGASRNTTGQGSGVTPDTGSDGSTTGSIGNTSTTPPAPGTTATPAPGSTDQGGASLTQEERQFFTDAASGGLFEVQSSQLALNENLGPEMQEFAEMMIADHQKINDELKQLAQKKNITLPTTMAPKEQSMMNELGKLNDQEFQNQYRQMQVRAHEEAVALFEKCANTAKDSDVKAFAQKHLPTLRRHLEHVQRSQGTQGPQGGSPPSTP